MTDIDAAAVAGAFSRRLRANASFAETQRFSVANLSTMGIADCRALADWIDARLAADARPIAWMSSALAARFTEISSSKGALVGTFRMASYQTDECDAPLYGAALSTQNIGKNSSENGQHVSGGGEQKVIAPATDALRITSLAWENCSRDDYTIHMASTRVGAFAYGTDKTGQPYHQDPTGEHDHPTEDAARRAAEAKHLELVREQAAELGILTVIIGSGEGG
ncbi:hypothetical protein [Ancylobacter defluvii]|uniref:Uncharacterized protein n=1 Tax=Ancylobacter defluvii TaxID=1282440 RepID=A0A9W6K0F5_9HYPH|nr:hypothetical protein [Ancylobacter defluvii]MBS7588236.1 hypothetical protein [Ancylobacter defluvii]GLK86632.1 hypothetical protein GCM10017653_47020 [Ancylobacter defluvii]